MTKRSTPQEKAATVESRFIGSWRLISCEHLRSDGTVEYPFGTSPKGRLVYLADRRMIVLITDPSRPLARSPQFFEATDVELAQAAKGCVAYSGDWSLRGQEVVHNLDQSMFPNWSGISLVRFYRFDGGKLVLTTGNFSINGADYTAALVWDKETRS